ncbi:hypothetical protein JHK82_025476 [Glycine max]|uniref:Transmembrane protein n=2 Tax=Glycine subgen. Soja TaxID=1462606 RepID=K7LEL4_SOYBN|nr:uncharacterized proline-rich protein [Glycine max]XP_028247710.1 uncharacterized proline-rich protein-like [Glycine soja]KAG4991958.1 hypothetical protein JHK87_025415 [Glycine soja]KAG5007556.1 hypothetical protein JHK85_026098 [Glycine max]KAG5013339.1 hypothetical protein JHK86_025600 [Glycine max]KAG5134288.1 hypothetical protein JHK82_025476 [Glycine max]KAH1043552.1 hypothetical protein GYH30_025411 [Glycine max]|eukprot:XP_003533351.1 uncharacterized proline-rich protein [Glycine max]
MARTILSSISVPFLILLMIVFTLVAQITPISADVKMRRLGPLLSPPPPPDHADGPHPVGPHPVIPPPTDGPGRPPPIP